METEIITTHVVSTLPDSISERKRILAALLKIIPKTYPRRAEIVLILEHIEAGERAQLKFTLTPEARNEA